MIRQLNISNYETWIILGNDDEEKNAKRSVIIDINIRFSQENNACCSDDIDQTVCYSKLINFIEKKLQGANFNLVEKVSKFLYDEISVYLNDKSVLKRIKVVKTSPPIKNLSSVSFTCSDW
ncbi:MAG: dihydroneopterin aldolase [Holosporaceae bacterium]|jgi:dihydroneopterin aldolase|nr:dihydroneopterin aldolase [Holosporaceae bacterium]